MLHLLQVCEASYKWNFNELHFDENIQIKFHSSSAYSEIKGSHYIMPRKNLNTKTLNRIKYISDRFNIDWKYCTNGIHVLIILRWISGRKKSTMQI